MQTTQPSIDRIRALIDRLRPATPQDVAGAEHNLWGEIARLEQCPDEAATLKQDFQILLSLPCQLSFYAETGILSSLGFFLELKRRLSYRLLPPPFDDRQLAYIMFRIFRLASDHEWIAGVDNAAWIALADALDLRNMDTTGLVTNLYESTRAISFRIAGTGLDRELLRAEPALELHESPFLAQNARLIPLLERAHSGGDPPDIGEIREVSVLLDQGTALLARVQNRGKEKGSSIRLTYLSARLEQHIERLRLLLELMSAEKRLPLGVALMKLLVTGSQTGYLVYRFISENISLVAFNVTGHASRRGEHYIAEDRSAWWAMLRSAAGGGVIIAMMAMLKVQIFMQDPPPLTESIAYGLNYGLGFVLIYLLGLTVATKQPAMTAASIAATLESTRPKELGKLADLVQNVVRTQFIAVVGNVVLAVAIGALIIFAWPVLIGDDEAIPDGMARHLLEELDPLSSGSLFYAAIAGVGLFLSGIVSGYYDNQARYRSLAARIADSPRLAWLGKPRARRFGLYIDRHYGGILGNFFFGMYLGIVGTFGELSGIPIQIRHVAFASANVGSAISTLGFTPESLELLYWAIAGVIGIALVNLLVSFTLALYVAIKSRGMRLRDAFPLATLLLKRFLTRPHTFFLPPEKIKSE